MRHKTSRRAARLPVDRAMPRPGVSNRHDRGNCQIAAQPPARQRRLRRGLAVLLGVVLGVAGTLLCHAGTSGKPSPASHPDNIPSSTSSFLDLVAKTPRELAHVDIAEMNLLCAQGLPGAEKLDVHRCLKTLDLWAYKVRFDAERHFYRFRQNPAEFHNSEGEYCMMMLISVLQQDFGVHYNKERIRNVDFKNAKDLFIHGMIGDQNGGTCVSMPVLYTAVARRLGWPVKLVLAKAHVFCRWENDKERLNIEGSGEGFGRFEDDHYKKWPFPISEDEVKAGLYLKSLTPQEELACFLASRGTCLLANGRTPEAQVAYALAHQLSPESRDYLGLLTETVGRTPLLVGYSPRPALGSAASQPSSIGPYGGMPLRPGPPQRGQPLPGHDPSPPNPRHTCRRRRACLSCRRRIHYSPETPRGEAIPQFGNAACAARGPPRLRRSAISAPRDGNGGVRAMPLAMLTANAALATLQRRLAGASSRVNKKRRFPMRRSSQLLVAVLALAVVAVNARTAPAYYSVAQGRFINRDLIGYNGGINMYEYVGDSPTSRTDSSGLKPNVGTVPGNVGQDIPPTAGTDCIFEAAGAPVAGSVQRKPPPIPPGIYIQGIKYPGDLLAACQGLAKKGTKCDRITVAGHAVLGCGSAP